MANFKRREFLKNTTLAAGAVSLVGPATWAGANDRINVAIIGMGGRGGSVMKTVAALDRVEVVKVCDPDRNRREKWAAELEALTGKRPAPEVDLRRIMDDPKIDAVIMTCCNHWHAPAGILACQAGKHAYVEKPISHNLKEGRMLVQAARRYQRVVMGGTQRRSHPNFRKAIGMIHEGIIGDIYMARWLLCGPRASIGFKKPTAPPDSLDWNLWRGPAVEQPYHENLVHYNWHWFWDFGGGEMGNNGSHLVDICHWGLGRSKGLPTRIDVVGGRFGYRDQAQTPNTLTATHQYPDGTLLVGEIRGHHTGEPTSWHFYGTKGHMRILTGGNFEIFLEGSKKPEPGIGNLPPVGKGFKKIDRLQFSNFFQAIREQRPDILNAEIEDIHLSNAFCHLDNISYRLGRELRFDPETETFPGDKEANQLLTRQYHPEFQLPEQV